MHKKKHGQNLAEILLLIEADKIDATPLITHRDKLTDIEEAYHLFEKKLDGVLILTLNKTVLFSSV